jgi:hypothetical protein
MNQPTHQIFRMKKTYTFFCVFMTTVLFSQISEKPLQYKKIHFVYETKSNYHVNQEGVYADSLLFQLDFPEVPFTALDSTGVASNYNAFVPWSGLSTTDIKKLSGILYHVNEKFIGVYDVTKDETHFKVFRNDEETKHIFKTIFKERYYNFSYTIIIKHRKNSIRINYPSVSYDFTIAEKINKIDYIDETLGQFTLKEKDRVWSNIVVLNPSLDPNIMPEDIFSNNNFGIETIKKMNYTTQLKSVSYSE